MTNSGYDMEKRSCRKPGTVTSPVRMQPPVTALRSSTQTRLPLRTNIAAQTSELMELPTITTSKVSMIPTLSRDHGRRGHAWGSMRGRKVRVELLADLHRLFVGEAAAGGEFGDRFEVAVLPARQGQVEDARRRVADVLDTMHSVARDGDDGARASRRSLVADGHLTGALDDEEQFFLVGMDVVRRTFTGFEPSHDDRDGAAGGLAGEEYSHVEAEGLDRQRLFGFDDGGLQRGSCVHVVSFVRVSCDAGARKPSVRSSGATPSPRSISSCATTRAACRRRRSVPTPR